MRVLIFGDIKGLAGSVAECFEEENHETVLLTSRQYHEIPLGSSTQFYYEACNPGSLLDKMNSFVAGATFDIVFYLDFLWIRESDSFKFFEAADMFTANVLMPAMIVQSFAQFMLTDAETMFFLGIDNGKRDDTKERSFFFLSSAGSAS